MDNDSPVFWVRNESGSVKRPGKRRIVSSVSRSDIRVEAALANTDRVQDCRGKSLYDMCLFVCLRHVNSISWDQVPQHIAANVMGAAHHAGTIADATVHRLITSSVHANFITRLRLANCALSNTWAAKLGQLAKSLTVCDFTNSVMTDPWVASLLHCNRLQWLGLSGTKLQDSSIKKLVYPTKYRKKGLTQLAYLDISNNPSITPHGVQLAATFPCLRVLVTKPADQKYMLFPTHELEGWGHGPVFRWLTGDLPPSATAPAPTSFYPKPAIQAATTHLYKDLLLLKENLRPPVSSSRPRKMANGSMLGSLVLISVGAGGSDVVEKSYIEPSSPIIRDLRFLVASKRSMGSRQTTGTASSSKRKRRPIKCIPANSIGKKRKVEETSSAKKSVNLELYSSGAPGRTPETRPSLFTQLDSGHGSFYF